MNPVKQYLSSIGRKGGKAGRGKSKARTKAQARAAALARWRKKTTQLQHPGLEQTHESKINIK